MGQLIYVPVSGGSTPVAVSSDIYISDANGNDANDGLTPGTAIQTVSRLWELLTQDAVINDIVVVHWGSGTYEYVPMPASITFSDQGGIVFYGDGAGQVGDDGFTELTTGTVTSAGTHTITDGAAAYVADEFVGKTLLMTSGATDTWRRTLSQNTSTVLTFTLEDLTGVAPGDTFRIVEPAVILDASTFSAAGPFAQGNMALPSPIAFVNFRLQGIGAQGYHFWQVSKYMLAFGLELAAADGTFIATDNKDNFAIAGVLWLPDDWVTATNLQFFLLNLFSGYSPANGWGLSGWDPAVGFAYLALSNSFTFYGVACGALWTSGGSPTSISVLGRVDGAAIYGSSYVRFQEVICTTRTNNLQVNSGTLETEAGAASVVNATTAVTVTGGRILAKSPGITINAPSLTVQQGGSIAGAGPVALNITGALLIQQNSIVEARGAVACSTLTIDNSKVTFGTGTVTPTGAVVIRNNSQVALSGTLTVAASTVTVSDNSQLTFTAGSHVISGTTNVLSATRNSQIVQNGGTLTVNASGGTAILADRLSRMFLRGGANTTTTAATQGASALAGSQIWFDASPTAIGGAAAAEIRVGLVGGQNRTLLTGGGAGAFITDVPVGGSTGTGGASVMGRAG